MSSNPEKSLESYIDIRSHYLPWLSLAAFTLIATSVFYFLWDAKAFYPLSKHVEIMEKIFSGKSSADTYLQALERKELIWPIIWHFVMSLVVGAAAAFLVCIPWLKSPDKMTWLDVREGV